MKLHHRFFLIPLALMTVISLPAMANNPFSDQAVNIQSSADASADKTAKAAVVNKNESGTVALANELNIRTSPWGDIIGTFKKGDKITIIGHVGDWYKISHNGKTAYVHSAYILKPDEKAKPFPSTGFVNCSLLNVRRVPGGDILSQIKNGQQINILGVAGDWYKISWGNNEAFVAKRYIDSAKPAAKPAADPYNFVGYVTASGLNVRQSPWGKIDATIPYGIAVKVIGKEGDWYKISYNGVTRYVHSDYISKTKGGTSGGSTAPATPAAGGSLQNRVAAAARALVGSTSFRGSDVAGGSLACAKVVSTALKNAGALSQVHLNVRSVVSDLKSKGWKEVSVPPFSEGDVITWKTYDYTGDGVKDPDTHVGIIIKEGNSYKAMNNSSSLKTPRITDPYSIGPVTRVLRKV